MQCHFQKYLLSGPLHCETLTLLYLFLDYKNTCFVVCLGTMDHLYSKHKVTVFCPRQGFLGMLTIRYSALQRCTKC